MYKYLLTAILPILLCADVIGQQSDHIPFSTIHESANAYFENEDITGYKQYKRMEHFMLNRLDKKGQLTNVAARNVKAFEAWKKQNLNRMPGTHNGSWEFVGPYATEGPKGTQGRVNRFGFHPTNENIVFAATAGGGIWKTSDKGMNWEPISDGLPVMNTTGIAIDFSFPNILYALSGDGDGVGSFNLVNKFTRSSVGVFKSTDGGGIWKPTGLNFDETTNVLAYNLYMDPSDRKILFAATNQGLFRTTNGAVTWDTIRQGLIYELEFKPESSSTIYCVDKNYIYISNDSGTTWSDSTLIPDVDGRDGRMTITTCPNNSDLVYLVASPVDTIELTDSIPDHRGLFVSTNSGADFTKVSTRPNVMAGHSGLEYKSQAWYDFALECNPLDSDELLVGTIGIFKSYDAGDTMVQVGVINGSDAYHADIHDIKVNPLDNMTYIASDGGVSISTDFGETYEYRSNTLGIAQYYRVATSPFFSDYVLLGAQDNAVQLRDGDETTFERVKWGDGMESIFHPSVDSLALTTIQSGKTYLSIDTGHTFDAIFPAITAGDTSNWLTPIAWDGDNPDNIYLGLHPIMKSTDMGQSWTSTSNDTISGHKILEIGEDDPTRLYAGDCRNCSRSSIRFEMYVSKNSGNTWDAIHGNTNFPGSGAFVSDATLNPDNSEEIWITCGRYDENTKVFRSFDAGDSWINLSDGLPNVPINAIDFQDTNGSPSGAVYVATDIGVFYRNDDLGDWIHFSNSLPAVEVTDLDIDYTGGLLRASTYGRGLWESNLFTDCIENISLTQLNQQIGHSYFHHADNMVLSTARVDGLGSKVIYKAGRAVVLTSGFEAKSKNGALFKSVLGGCEEGGIEGLKDQQTTQY